MYRASSKNKNDVQKENLDRQVNMQLWNAIPFCLSFCVNIMFMNSKTLKLDFCASLVFMCCFAVSCSNSKQADCFETHDIFYISNIYVFYRVQHNENKRMAMMITIDCKNFKDNIYLQKTFLWSFVQSI